MKRVRIASIILIMVLISSLVPASISADSDSEEITVLFTHDTHDYLYSSSTMDKDKLVNHGGAAKLKTLVDQNMDENTIYVDAGDYSMGTLTQVGFTEAFELRNLGLSGCAITTFGNHEFDLGLSGVNKMLRAALDSGDSLPDLLIPNIDFGGEQSEGVGGEQSEELGAGLSAEQAEFKSLLEEYGAKRYEIREIAGR